MTSCTTGSLIVSKLKPPPVVVALGRADGIYGRMPCLQLLPVFITGHTIPRLTDLAVYSDFSIHSSMQVGAGGGGCDSTPSGIDRVWHRRLPRQGTRQLFSSRTRTLQDTNEKESTSSKGPLLSLSINRRQVGGRSIVAPWVHPSHVSISRLPFIPLILFNTTDLLLD
jgi:hypothetical protein